MPLTPANDSGVIMDWSLHLSTHVLSFGLWSLAALGALVLIGRINRR